MLGDIWVFVYCALDLTIPSNDREKQISTLVPYFSGCKMQFFSFQNQPKNLDPSNKTDLDLFGIV